MKFVNLTIDSYMRYNIVIIVFVRRIDFFPVF